MKTISLIAAMARGNVIGLDNKMPWHLSADLKHFKALTMGKPIIMGRKTFESLGRVLPGRENIVISNNPNYDAPGATVYTSLLDALDALDAPEVMIIGGGQLFAQALPMAKVMYLTMIDVEVDGDAFFPQWDEKGWSEVMRDVHPADETNPLAYTYVTLHRK
ncbi:MAG: type 3 dihydrofolate reductase [Gammaproteobacteria bacterium]